MLDDLLELVLDFAVELGGASFDAHKKRTKHGKQISRSQHGSNKEKLGRKTPGSTVDPWDRPQVKPPWER